MPTDFKHLTVHHFLPPENWDFRWTTSLLDETFTLFTIDFDSKFIWSRRLCLIGYIGKSNHILFPNYWVDLDVVLTFMPSIHVSSIFLTSVVHIRLWSEYSQVNKYQKMKVNSRSLWHIRFLECTLQSHPLHIFHLINSNPHLSDLFLHYQCKAGTPWIVLRIHPWTIGKAWINYEYILMFKMILLCWLHTKPKSNLSSAETEAVSPKKQWVFFIIELLPWI